MIQVASLDPSSLALWVDQEMISRIAQERSILEIVQNCALGDVGSVLNAVEELPDPQAKRRAIRLAGTIWHEQRHFLDLILTNYGAFRVRQFLSLYVNIVQVFSTAHKSGSPLVCPLDVYLDPVRRSVLGIETVPEVMTQVAKEVQYRESMARADREGGVLDGQHLEMGGDAQLEALGFMFQQSTVTFVFGEEEFVALEASLLPEERSNLRYRWIFLLADSLGLLNDRNQIDQKGVDSTLLTALLIGSLASRRWGQEQSTTPGGSKSGYCVERLRGLIDTIREMGFKPFKLADSAWELVNEAAKKAWGRTVLEEMLEDYAREGKWVTDIQAISSVPDSIKLVCEDFHSLRGRLLQALQKNPEWLLDPVAYSISVLSKLRPITVISSPSGVLGKPPSGWHMVSGYNDPNSQTDESSWWWSATPSKPDYPSETLAFGRWKEWMEVVDWYAPLAKLLMKGRAHRTQYGPELVTAEMRLNAMNVEINFDPLFAYPRELRTTAASFFNLTGTSEGKCDMCKLSIPRGTGWILSPWVFRRKPALAEAAIKGFGGGTSGRLRFIRDWSVWLVCDRCDKIASS
jgi:hypothetical protein